MLFEYFCSHPVRHKLIVLITKLFKGFWWVKENEKKCSFGVHTHTHIYIYVTQGIHLVGSEKSLYWG